MRVISAIVGVPILLLSAWLGGPILFSLVTALMLVALYEMRGILVKLKVQTAAILFFIGGLIILPGALFYEGCMWLPAVPALILLHFSPMVFKATGYPVRDGVLSVLATVYVGFFMYVYLVGVLPNGWQWLLLLLLTTWANDTFAYFVGTKLGRHKLAPTISPNKTIEGAIGGIFGSLITGLLWGLYFGLLGLNVLVILSVFLAIAGQAGDLVESAIKRAAGIKDAGKIIPGHGGVLDRFDSLLLAAPLLYHYLVLFVIK